jgi:hypothetical protein
MALIFIWPLSNLLVSNIKSLIPSQPPTYNNVKVHKSIRFSDCNLAVRYLGFQCTRILYLRDA